MMAFALALTVVAVVVIVVSRDEPEQAAASENAANSPVEPLVSSDRPKEASVEESLAEPAAESEPPAEPRLTRGLEVFHQPALHDGRPIEPLLP